MKREIEYEDFQYHIVRSKRRTLSLEVRTDGEVLVRAPQAMSEARIRRFIDEKRAWILKNLDKVSRRQEAEDNLTVLSEEQKNDFRRQAGAIFAERAAHFARIMGVEYGRITIREQKTRWGSCSSNHNLNFNWKLVLAPREVLDYVVVHELCHLKEMNHSPQFWAEVEKIQPDYRVRRKWLKDHGWMLMKA